MALWNSVAEGQESGGVGSLEGLELGLLLHINLGADLEHPHCFNRNALRELLTVVVCARVRAKSPVMVSADLRLLPYPPCGLTVSQRATTEGYGSSDASSLQIMLLSLTLRSIDTAVPQLVHIIVYFAAPLDMPNRGAEKCALRAYLGLVAAEGAH